MSFSSSALRKLEHMRRMYAFLCEASTPDYQPPARHGSLPCDRLGPRGACSRCSRRFLDENENVVDLDAVRPENERGNRH